MVSSSFKRMVALLGIVVASRLLGCQGHAEASMSMVSVSSFVASSSLSSVGFCPPSSIPTKRRDTSSLMDATRFVVPHNDKSDLSGKATALFLSLLEHNRLLETKRQEQQLQEEQPKKGFQTGSTYLSEMNIPILGKQAFSLRITSPNTARLSIQGRILRLSDDQISFTVDDETGHIQFVLSQATQNLLRRFRTRLGRVAYDNFRDEAQLEVRPPLPKPIHLQFKRVFQ